MPDPSLPSHFDPQKVTQGIGVVAAIAGAVVAPFKVFMTKKEANSKFVRKVEEDGTRIYVHAEDWKEMKGLLKESIEQGNKWQAIAKDWMEHP